MPDSLRPHGLKHARLIFLYYPMEFVKSMSIELVMLSNHLILCHPLLHLPSVFPSIKSYMKLYTLPEYEEDTFKNLE